MKLYYKAFLYHKKWIQPYIHVILRLIDAITYFASLLLIAGVIYEHGFRISFEDISYLNALYKGVWIVFLISVTSHLLLEYRDTKKNFKSVAWILSILLYLTLVPVIFYEPDVGAVRYVWLALDSKVYHVILLLLLSLLQLSNGIVRLLGKRTNPSLILASSFFLIILIGTGLLLLPRSTYNGISWVDALFTATSATCVTGLVSVDVPSTFTTEGLIIIILLIQIGGLGVMTLTSFFAMFFMGNTSLYNQLVVRDMVSSDSLGSLLSTLLYILGFTLVIETGGMIALFLNIHGTLGMSLEGELAFAAFHSISAFCNAGFSTLLGNLGNPALMEGHNLLYITISVLIILGGIGFPILVNFKSIISYYLKRFYRILRYRKPERHRIPHLYNLNTKIVLIMTFLLLFIGTVTIAIFDWNHAFAGMSMTDKWVQAFFNATCPRTAGFTSVGLSTFSVQTILLMILLMFIGGASQSTAGGVKVNAFAVIILNLWAILRGNERVEVFGRELSSDSIRRSNATMLMYLVMLFLGVFVLSILEPELSILALTFECTSALSTVGSSLDATPLLSNPSKLIVSFLMFVGRVGMITLLLGIIRQKKVVKYRYPSDNIIIN
ncbi:MULTISPECIES: TrkH family potassium uptake protein [unclassified Bacteroides]|jgi:Trk-type K+ transport system membrane component|uniref:TrkH family potassium uptake protein n=1 Tax=unclassified Bacteroides TaxID=2646097 RepID=UPI000E7F78B0|nr:MULTISPECIES: potassium transporter TrkG [unclassified Bacteroides]RGN48068.1 potassium transporter [Bacteroides sp. OM05-12]RHR76267.1 potassium transporter [Bacteroides sp. AF16-49]